MKHRDKVTLLGDIEMSGKAFDTLMIIGIIVSVGLFSLTTWLLWDKVECLPDPCSQCMSVGYMCTDPYAKVEWADITEEICNGTTK